MKWLYLSTSSMVLATALLFSGCGADSNEACAYQVEQNLDHGNYDAVIATLENNGTCNGALTQTDAWTNLAGAYLGKSGITLGALVSTVVNNTSADPMSSFLQVFGTLATSQGLQNMSNAATTYGYIRALEGFPDCNNLVGASAIVQDSCFYEELTNTIKTVSVMSAVMGNALSFITTPVVAGSVDDVNDNSTADELEVTGCAIALAGTAGAATDCSTVTPTSIAFTDAASVVFTGGPTLIPRTFTVTDLGGNSGGNQTYYRMMSTVSPASPVTTSGSCDINYNPCTTVDNASCFPCPVIINGTSVSSTTVILDSINNGTITGVTPNQMEQACYDAETAKPVGHICVVDGNFTDVELAQFMSLL